MKKYYFMAIAAIGMMAACNKVEVGNTTPPTPEIDDTTVEAVKFGISTNAIDVKTRANGAVGGLEENNVWNGQELYIYGIDKTVTDLAQGDIFINNIKATAPLGEAATASGLIEVLDPEAVEGEPFYYGANNVYDFYGYHIDDAFTGGGTEVTPTVTADKISIPFTINGGQDLMIAKTIPANDIANSPNTGVKPERVYSAYAARRGIQPTLVFEHQLARFVFEIEANASSVLATGVNVTSISLESKTKGELVILDKAENGKTGIVVDAEDVATPLLLQELTDGNAPLKVLTPQAPTTTAAQIGESLLVIAEEGTTEYKMSVGLTQVTNAEGETINKVLPALDYTLKASALQGEGIATDKFQPGYTYKVKIIVYGAEEVKITAELTAWKDGGNIEVDPDKDIENEDNTTEEPLP